MNKETLSKDMVMWIRPWSTMRMLVGEISEKGSASATYADLEKAWSRIDWEGL